MPGKELPRHEVIPPIPTALRKLLIDRKQRFAEGLKERLANPITPPIDRLQEAIDSGKIKP